MYTALSAMKEMSQSPVEEVLRTCDYGFLTLTIEKLNFNLYLTVVNVSTCG